MYMRSLSSSALLLPLCHFVRSALALGLAWATVLAGNLAYAQETDPPEAPDLIVRADPLIIDMLPPPVRQYELDRLNHPLVQRISYGSIDTTPLRDAQGSGASSVVVNVGFFSDAVFTMELLKLTRDGDPTLERWGTATQELPFVRLHMKASPSLSKGEFSSDLLRTDTNESIYLVLDPGLYPIYVARKVGREANLWAFEERLLGEIVDGESPVLGAFDLGSWATDSTEGGGVVQATLFYTPGTAQAFGSNANAAAQVANVFAAEFDFLQYTILPNSGIFGQLEIAGVERVPDDATGVLWEQLANSRELFLLRRGWGGDIAVVYAQGWELPFAGQAGNHRQHDFFFNPQAALILMDDQSTNRLLGHEFGHLNGGCHQLPLACTFPYTGTSRPYFEESAPSWPMGYATLLRQAGDDPQVPCQSCEVVPAYSVPGGFWNGNLIGTEATYNAAAVEDSFSFLPSIMGAPQSHTVSVIKQGDGAEGGFIERLDLDGQVAGDIVCGDNCSELFPLGRRVHLRVDEFLSEQGGAIFVEWSGECTFTANTPLDQSEIDFLIDEASSPTIDCYATFDSTGGGGSTFLTVEKIGTTQGTVLGNPGDLECDTTCSSRTVAIPEGDQLVFLEAIGIPGETTWSGWGEACSDLLGPTGWVEVFGDVTCLVAFEEEGSTSATLQIDVINAGRIEANGINCPGDCTEAYPLGTDIELQAFEADGGGGFNHWEGDCIQDSETLRLATVHMDGLKTCTGVFDEPGATNPLTLEKSGTGFGIVQTIGATPSIFCGTDCSDGTAQYPEPDTITIDADAGDGNEFGGWTGDGCNSSNERIPVAMSVVRTCTAEFVPIDSRQLKVLVQMMNPDPSLFSGNPSVDVDPGDITCDSSCFPDMPADVTVTLSANDDGDFRLTSWLLDCVAGPNGNQSTVLMDENKQCTAVFRCFADFPGCMDPE